MKKFIFGLVIGLVIATSVGVVAYSMSSKDISYDNTTSGSESTNVQGAIDELYGMVNGSAQVDLLWTNPNPTANFTTQTVTLDLTHYSGIIIEGVDNASTGSGHAFSYVPKDSVEHDVTIGWYTSTSVARKVAVTDNNVTFSTAHQRGYQNNTAYDRAVPLYIYGTSTNIFSIEE